MRRIFLAGVILTFAPSAFAQVLVSTSRGIVVAHDRRVELVGGWSVAGVEHPTAIVKSEERVAVLDAIENLAVIVDLSNGRSQRFKTAETPIDGAFLRNELHVLCRDAQVVERFTMGPPASSPAGPAASRRRVDPDSAFLRQSNGRLLVYSRATGALQELGGPRVLAAPFASDFEIAGDTGYLVFPREARVRTVDLRSMKVTGEISVGAVPVDLTFAGGGTAITARILAIADPSAKRVWLTESSQSTTQSIARGFLRGFLGLGLFGARSSQFPTGVDRVLISGKNWIAYDTSSGTLYRFTKKSSRVLARGVPSAGFAATPDGVAFWLDGRVRLAN